MSPGPQLGLGQAGGPGPREASLGPEGRCPEQAGLHMEAGVSPRCSGWPPQGKQLKRPWQRLPYMFWQASEGPRHHGCCRRGASPVCTTAVGGATSLRLPRGGTSQKFGHCCAGEIFLEPSSSTIASMPNALRAKPHSQRTSLLVPGPTASLGFSSAPASGASFQNRPAAFPPPFPSTWSTRPPPHLLLKFSPFKTQLQPPPASSTCHHRSPTSHTPHPAAPITGWATVVGGLGRAGAQRRELL